MKKHEHQYVTGMVTGAIVGFLMVILAYWIIILVDQGVAITAILLLVSSLGMLLGAVISYLISQTEEGPHFVLKRKR